MAQDQNRIGVVWLSLLAALLLTIVPIPSAIEIYRPQWVVLFVIYWTIALPQRVSVGMASCLVFYSMFSPAPPWVKTHLAYR